jgi:hypothetical protein
MAIATAPRRRKLDARSKPTSDRKNAPVSPETVTEAITRLEKKVKLSSETLKKLFTSESPSTEVKKLKELIRDRVKDGRNLSLKDWRVYAAIDEAYNAPFHQITPTLIGKIMNPDRRLTQAQIEQELARWGLSESTLFTELQHPTDPTKKQKILNRQTFVKVLVPIVKALLNARESKLFMDRDNNPFLHYSAYRQTEESKMIGDVITAVVEGITTSYGLKSVLRSAIHQALKYSFCIAFPAEAWHHEQDIDADGNVYTKKEGVRYNLPHPSRTAWDQNFRPSTLNTDTGCTWAMYWRLSRFGDVDTNPAYYNKDKISYGTGHWFTDYQTYFETIYPCVMEKPVADLSAWKTNPKEYVATLYTSNDYDKAIFLTEMFMKLSPKQWGLGEYTHQIWFRFVVTNDDTVVYAEPLPYSPALYMGTDADDSVSARTASFALEATPWQDLVGNILSNHLIGLKQNAKKIIPYDVNQVTPAKILEIEARSQSVDEIVWAPYDSREFKVAGLNPGDMFKSISFPQVNIAENIQTMVQVFNVMERALGMSAQEVGAIAGHIQTAEEIRTVSQNTSARLDYLGSFIDEFMDAMKRQIYVGYQSFGDEEFTVYVNGVDQKIAEKLNKKYGFNMESAGRNIVEVKGDITKLSVDAFISSREGKTRMNQTQISQIIMQTLQVIAGNPELAMKVGPEEILRHLNRAMKMAGAPDDSDFKISEEQGALAQMKQLAEAIQQYAKQITDQATQQATEAATQAATETATQAVDQAAQQVVPAIEQTQQVAVRAAEGAQQAQAGVEQVAAMAQELQLAVQRLNGVLAMAMQPPPQPTPEQPFLPVA